MEERDATCPNLSGAEQLAPSIILILSSRSGKACRILSLLLSLAIGLNAIPSFVEASDHWNLEEELPTEVEDAYASDYLTPELQSLFRYERIHNGGERFVLSPRLLYGFDKQWQAKVAVPFLFGSADNTGSGTVALEVLHQFTQESAYAPALAFAVGLGLPSGVRSHGVDTELKVIGTKAFGKSYLEHRVHVNLAWNHNTDPLVNERTDRYVAILGYSHPIPADIVLVMDFAREQELDRTRTANLAEVGFRRMVTPVSVVSLGAGLDVSKEFPGFRVTIGFQYSFE